MRHVHRSLAPAFTWGAPLPGGSKPWVITYVNPVDGPGSR